MNTCVRCTLPASHFQGSQRLCPQHYRFGQMRAAAKRRGLVVPSRDDLATMVTSDMRCPECKNQMHWLGRDGYTGVATLQHYRDGTMSIVCKSCNSRHHYAPNDSYRETPKDQKFCPQCEEFKPDTNFYADNGRSGPRKLKSWCKKCSNVAKEAWRVANLDRYNAARRVRKARTL